MKYNDMTWGQMEAVVNKLGGMDGIHRLLTGENVVQLPTSRDWKVWKTIQLGTHKDVPTLLRAMKDEGVKVSDDSNDIMGKPEFTLASEATDIQLVRVTVAELGSPKGAHRDTIYECAQQLGLSLVPAEVGPQLRRQDKDQPRGEGLLTAMEPITGSDGSLSVFGVEHDSGRLWLHTGDGDPDSFWYGSSVWVFALRK